MEAKLKPKQRLFCEYYVSHEKAHGNGAQCYALAYGYGLIETSDKYYETAKSNAYKLLNKPEIKACIKNLLRDQLLDDTAVGIELGHLIRQNTNLQVKRQAIGEYYRMTERLSVNKKDEAPAKTNPFDEEYEARLTNAATEALYPTSEQMERYEDALDLVTDVYDYVEDVQKGLVQLPPEIKAKYNL